MIGKRFVCILLVLCALMGVACAAREENAPIAEEQGTTTEDSQGEDDARLAYYEQLVGSLQSEILAMKAELFSIKSDYEARIAELEAERDAAEQLRAFTYTVSGEGVTITGYKGRAINVEIPEAIDGKQVIAIADRAFYANTTLQSVRIPSGVKTLGWFVFSGCISLGAVHIPSSVESISYGAFENCPRTLTVYAPKGSYAAQYAASYGIATVG